LSERVEQRLAIGEMPAGSAVADADLARQLAQRQILGAALAHSALGLFEQSLAEVAVVIGALGHRAMQVSDRC
jgi:hypothetical protein